MTKAAVSGLELFSVLPGKKENNSRPDTKRRPLIMGVVNVTPDSFYPGSRTPDAESAVARGLALVEQGADLLDIGGQSTRPGSDPVALGEELRRAIPVVEALAARAGVPVSIDTDKAEVARLARAAGARVLNDVTALRADPQMLRVSLDFEAVVLMHMGGESPKTMQESPRYGDVAGEVVRFLKERRDAFARAGGDPGRLIYDPGLGFGKDLEEGHNLSLLKRLEALTHLGPVLVGASRKAFLGRLAGGAGPQDRLEGSLAVACWAALRGAAIVRAHDVRATRRALDVIAAISEAR